MSETDYEIILRRISERVWRYTDTLYNDIEKLLNAGFFEGKSAREIAKQLRKFLANPSQTVLLEVESLLQSGEITEFQANRMLEVASKPVGLGVYRSPLRNAQRLARTEINMAYHKQDYINRQKLPFVVGIKVNLSDAHPRVDMCDFLKGEYPPDFIFTGWHPQCLCHTTSILAPEKEIRKFYRDENPNFKYVKGFPAPANKWIKDNSKRINNAPSKPFWITDNKIKT